MPEEPSHQLKACAAAHRRSPNRGIPVCLEQASAATPADVPRTLARVDALRERLRVPPATDVVLAKARDAGRS